MTAKPDPALRQQVLDAILVILPRVLGSQPPAIADGTELRTELGLRSASTLELLLELEDTLEIEIDVQQIVPVKLTTIGDLADFVAAQSLAG